MVDSESSPGSYKTLKVSIGAIIQNPEMLEFVPDQLKTRKMCKTAVKKLPFGLRYVRNRYKTQNMWYKAVDNYFHSLKFSLDCWRLEKYVMRPLIFKIL